MSLLLLLTTINKKKLILDILKDVGVVSACSLRKLYANYNGPCIRIRRASDSIEMDIGFVGNDVDISAIQAFSPANTVYVVKIYDQSGKGESYNHIIQTSDAALQPRISNIGSIYLVNGKPAIYFAPSNNKMYIPHSNSVDLQNFSVSMITKPVRAAGAATEQLIAKATTFGVTTGWGMGLRTADPKLRMAYYGNSLVVTNATPPDPRDGNNHHLAFVKNGGNQLIYENGINYIDQTNIDQTITNTVQIDIGHNAYGWYNGYIQEIILFSGNIQNLITQIYNDSKSYYGVV